jgi:hypothetical protein
VFLGLVLRLGLQRIAVLNVVPIIHPSRRRASRKSVSVLRHLFAELVKKKARHYPACVWPPVRTLDQNREIAPIVVRLTSGCPLPQLKPTSSAGWYSTRSVPTASRGIV